MALQPLPESTSVMQSWQINSYGDVKQLKLASAKVPHISEPDQLLIKVKATALNPIDLAMLGGYGKSLFGLLRFYKTEFPLTLGREFSGTVVDKGRCVTEFNIGDDVYGITPAHKQGCQAEYVVADKLQILLRPSHLSPIEAASILYASITAWSALFATGGLRESSKATVLILGASGGVGTLATQILKAQKNITVVGLCSTDAVTSVTSLGADHVYDYKDPEHILNVGTHGTYDIILDCAKYGYEKIPNNWKYKKFITLNSPLLKHTDQYGLVAGLALSAGDIIVANAPRFFNGNSVQWAYFSPVPDAFKLLDKLVNSNQLKPIIQKVFKFSEVPEAFSMLSAGHLRGKIVINLQESN